MIRGGVLEPRIRGNYTRRRVGGRQPGAAVRGRAAILGAPPWVLCPPGAPYPARRRRRPLRFWLQLLAATALRVVNLLECFVDDRRVYGDGAVLFFVEPVRARDRVNVAVEDQARRCRPSR